MIGRCFLVVFLCVVAGVALGLGIGLLMGSLAPSFGLGLLGLDPERYDGSQVCIGLGVANGAWLGVVAGIGIIIAEAIRKSRGKE